MKKVGIVSYNIYGNFTNYGSALQSWALSNAINKVGQNNFESILIDYCPDILADKDPLNPMKHMWDADEESRRMCELSLPAIRENFKKFDRFYHERFNRTKAKYTSANFNDVINEGIDAFVCGSDTIFCIDEFAGFDDGYYANYRCMKNGYTISYAASFGDSHFTDDDYATLNERLKNFKAIGIRERDMLNYIREHFNGEVCQNLDPTLLLMKEDYEELVKTVKPVAEKDSYLLLYSRRYNPVMEEYAEKISEALGLKIIEISLRAVNAERHQMFYEAGVEEFLSLVKNAAFVVTNSYHGIIFSIQYQRPFVAFSREQGDTKIKELLNLCEISERLLIDGSENLSAINYDAVHDKIVVARKKSLNFLEKSLKNYELLS